MGNRDVVRVSPKRKFPAVLTQIKEPRHCDEYIDDPDAPEVLRKFLSRAREPYPLLYADFEGHPVRVTMASRFGDLGISYNLDPESSYSTRVSVAELTNFRDTPSA